MKNILIILGIIILVILGYFFFIKKPLSSEQVNSNEVDTNKSVVSGKININAVCEGALSYMTFSRSEEADLFVSECKAGNRPEVIEKYKADMNLGAGASI
ncbi:MAG: hypothetical protein ACYCZW_01185 [Minisyncoccota bacterium]